MTHNSPLKPKVSRNDELEVVLVGSPSFVAFDRWMDAQLATLVDRWSYMAAPRAQRSDAIQRRLGR